MTKPGTKSYSHVTSEAASLLRGVPWKMPGQVAWTSSKCHLMDHETRAGVKWMNRAPVCSIECSINWFLKAKAAPASGPFEIVNAALNAYAASHGYFLNKNVSMPKILPTFLKFTVITSKSTWTIRRLYSQKNVHYIHMDDSKLWYTIVWRKSYTPDILSSVSSK